MTHTRKQRIITAATSSVVLVIVVGAIVICIEQGRSASTLGWTLLWAGITLFPALFSVFLAQSTVKLWMDAVRGG